MKHRQCQAIAKSTDKQCSKRALPKLKYCIYHTEKLAILISFLIGAIASVFGPEVYHLIQPSQELQTSLQIQKQVDSIKHELKPSDFDLELISRRHAAKAIFDFEAPKSLLILGKIGPIGIDATLELESRGESAFPSGRNPWRVWHYECKRRHFTMNGKVTLDSLVGQRIWIRIPTRKLHEFSVNELRLWIRGRQLPPLNPNAEGVVEYEIVESDISK